MGGVVKNTTQNGNAIKFLSGYRVSLLCAVVCVFERFDFSRL
jgi:hypothetical protein